MDSLRAAVAHEHSSDLKLDSGMREKFADHFGPVASKVRFVESDLPAQLGAKALAQGDTIRVAPGAYTPGTESGEKLLAHELGHVVQQSRGEAMDGAGMPLLDSSVEHGADAIADSAMSGSLNLSCAPAPAASAPMLGLGIFSRLKGWFSRKAMSDEQKRKVKEQVALRPWKMTAEQLKRNKYNPGNSMDVARDNWILNSGWVEGADNEYNLRTIEENFGTLLDSGKAEGQLDKRMSANGVRERMLNMTRMLTDFPELRKFFKGNDNIENVGTMSVTPTADGPEAGILHWNPQKVVNKKGYAEPKPGETAEEKKQREAENKTWLVDRLGLANKHHFTDDSYTGNHELGHMLNIMLWKKKSSLSYQKDYVNGDTNNDLINKSLKHLQKRAKKKNLAEELRKYTKILDRAKEEKDGKKVNRKNYRTGKKEDAVNFGRGREKQILSDSLENKKTQGASALYNSDPEIKEAYDKIFGPPQGAAQALTNAAQAPTNTAPAPENAASMQSNEAPVLRQQNAGSQIQHSDDSELDAKVRKVVNRDFSPLQQPGKEAELIRGLAQGATNRNALVSEREISSYGATNVTETIAEAFADVYAHGKKATKLNKQLVKRMWRQLNPDAAYEEYQQKQADYASGKRRKPGTR